MMESFHAVFSLASFIYLYTVFFFALTLVLRKQNIGTTRLRNFSLAHKSSFLNKEFKCELFYPFIGAFITNPITALAISGLLLLGFGQLPHHVLSQYVVSLPLWAQVIAGLLCLDLSLYIRHRFVHTYFWPYHAVHHCAQEIGWLTNYRLHPVDQFVMSFIDFMVLYLIGFSTEGMGIAIFIKSSNNLFVHSNIVLDYGKPLKYIFVSPNMHRWHHATETQAHNKNYCVIFAFIDLAFGSYYVPDNALPESYGSGYGELDDLKNKNILKELYYPFVLTWRKLCRSLAP